MELFEKLALFFSKHSKQNDKRFAEFQEFEEYVINNFPANITKLIVNKVHPSSNHQSYCAAFTMADYLWWKTQYENELVVMLPIDDIKRQTALALSEVLDKNFNTPDNSKLMMDLFNQFKDSNDDSEVCINLSKS